MAYRFLRHGISDSQAMTWQGLQRQVRDLAGWLASRADRGDRILLAYPAGLEFIVAFYACLQARLIPVPVPVPNRGRAGDRHYDRLQNVAADCDPALLLSVDSVRSRLPLAAGEWHFSDRLELPRSPDTLPAPELDDVALLQYTSGSTQAPRGVVISHRALLEQLEHYRLRAGGDWDRMVFVGWLPHHHDFGLVGFILSALYLGAPYTFLSPAAFLQGPLRWLQAVSKYRATYSGGPNFAYELCAKIGSPEPLDLSCWKIASVGGEPVCAATMQRFVETFAPHGFPPRSLLPAYGLAESVLCVTAKPGAAVRHFDAAALRQQRVVPATGQTRVTRALVNCGAPLPGQSICIVDPDASVKVPGDRVGEIWLSGDGRASGYWRDDVRTASTFQARLPGESECYLRTGDCGFLLDGELFVTGRLNDLIIARGCNHSPEEIEWTIQDADPALGRGCGAVFQVTDDLAAAGHSTSAAAEPRIVAIQEVNPEIQRPYGELFAAIRRRVAENHGLRLDAIELIRPRSLPRTSNGKVCRHQCRAAYRDGRLRTVASSTSQLQAVDKESLPCPGDTPVTAIEGWMLDLLRGLLPGVPIGVDDNFFSVGGDSLTAQRFLALVRDTFDVELPVSALFDAPDIASLARQISQNRGSSASATPIPPADRPAGAPVFSRAEPSPATVPLSDGLAGETVAVLRELRALNALATQQVNLLAEQNRLLAQQVASLWTLRGEGPAITGPAGTVESLSLPLTAAQHDIRLLPELFPEAAAVFHSMMVLELKQAPVEQSVRSAFQQLAARHDALRLALDGERQRIEPRVEPEIRTVCLASADEVGPWLRQERQQPIDVSRAPMWRVTLVTVAAAPPLLIFTAHHLVVDGWSLNVLAGEFAICYQASLQGEDCALPQVQSFRDFCAELSARQAPAMLEPHRAYWRQTIGSQLPGLDLPDDPPQSSPSYLATTFSLELDGNLRGALLRLGAQASATLFHTLLAAWFGALHRLTGQDRLVIGVESSSRRDALRPLVGCCNTLVPIVVEVPDDPTVAQFLELVRKQVLEGIEHQDYTLAMLSHDLKTPRDPRQPFRVTATINLLRVAENGVCRPRCDLDAQSVTQSPFGLTLDVRDLESSLRLDFIYNTSLFDRGATERLAGMYRDTLTRMAEFPSSRLFGQPILSADEAARIRQWGDGGPGYAGVQAFPQQFESQVAAFPDRVAVIGETGELTYRDLNRRANQVARSLRESGGGPGAVVAVLGHRGGDYLAALLGILKGGCVYLPLDPKSPDARLRRQLVQSQARLLVCGNEFLATATELARAADSCALVVLDDALTRSDFDAEREHGTGGRSLDDPAYALYTSGSTGEPKGVLVSHRGLMNHLHAKIRALGLVPTDVVAQTASVCFDISVWQFLAPLLAGATVRVLDDAVTHDPRALLCDVDRLGITIFQSVPTMIRAMVETEAARPSRSCRLPSLRWMISIGEVLPPDLARKWISYFPRTPLLNSYGPAECSDTVTHHAIVWPPGDERRVPIGRPIAGAQLYVLDRRRQMVPAGTAGELYIGGCCVGLGYLNDPARTGAAFVPDPGSPTPGGRLYRTGDRARFRPDGNLEFLGRCDRQLKIHGVRVEPGEIEAVLQEHPHVVQSVVTVKQPATGPAVLAAYVVVRPGTAVAAGVLRALARNKLPQGLVPSVVVFLDRLPTTANGKVDDALLPEPVSEIQPAEATPPATPVQRELVRIWTEVIHQERIGIHDDLFELGGRSLDAARIATRIGDRFNFRMPVSEVLRTPTVAGIATYIEQRRSPGGTMETAWASQQG